MSFFMKYLTWITSLIVLMTPAFGHYLALTDPIYFDQVYTREDGLIESMTSANLFFCFVICMYRVVLLRKLKASFFIAFTVLIGLGMLFGAGEEISWGQRIFHLTTPDTLEKYNHQGEINLHNLQLGGVKINKLIFSQLLGLVLAVYFFCLPFLFSRLKFVRVLSAKFAVPIAQNWHVLLFLLSGITAAAIQQNRRWEILEFCGSAIFFLIFLNPKNQDEFSVTPSDSRK